MSILKEVASNFLGVVKNATVVVYQIANLVSKSTTAASYLGLYS